MPQGRGTIDDERDLVAAARQGELSACEQIVRRHGLEVLRTSYLLHGDARQAWRATHAAFLTLFRQMPRPDDHTDLRHLVLLHAGRSFLAPPEGDGDEPATGLTLMEVQRSNRYQVDDARSRTREALALLDPPVRLALVLRDLNGLSIEEIAPLVGERPDQTTVALETARRRVRNHLSLRPEESLPNAIAAATFDAPSGNVWTGLEDDVAAMLRQQGQRKQVISAAVITVMLLAMVATLGLLLRESPADEVAAVETRFVTDAFNDPPPFPTIAPPRATGTSPARTVRVPTPVAAPEPVASVPDTLLMALRHGGSADGLANLTEFRPWHSVKSQPLVDWPRETRERWAPVISPDGRTLYIAQFETEGNDARALVRAVDIQSMRLEWQAELDTVPAMPAGERLDLFVRLAVDEEHVFATLHYWKSNDLIQLVLLDRATGERVDGWPVNIAGRIANDVQILRPAGSEHVYVYAITQAQPALSGQLHISFYGYEVDTGVQVHGKTLVETESRRVLHIYLGQVTADGRTLWGTTYQNNAGALSVQFFDLLSATVQRPVPVPFNVEGNREPVQQAVSHDGRWLYIFSPLSTEMAIVDLERRSLLGVVPLEVHVSGGLGSVNLLDTTMQVSPDGAWIYAIGAEGNNRSSGVLAIDTSTWQVSRHWLPETAPSRILLSGDGATLFIHELPLTSGALSHGKISAVDTATGNLVMQEHLAFLPDDTGVELASLASLYRKQYGRSPAVGDLVPVDNRAYTTLPAVKASMTMPEVQAGDQVGITVRFVDPFTRNQLTENQTDVRYEPATGVRAILRDQRGEHSDVIVELGRNGYAEYGGSVTVNAPGDWTLILVNDWSGTSQYITTRTTLKVLSAVPGFGIGSL